VNAALGPPIAAWLQAHESISGLRPFASYLTVFSVLSLFFWVGTARIVRSQVLQIRERDFVTAARALGGGTWHVIWVHLVPNIAFLLVLQLSGTLGAVAGSEIALTWFGVGVQPPTPSFGAMIFEGSGTRNFQAHPHLLLVPGICVSALLFAFALLGDAINDVIRQR
jgi:ABC-type dipeptide/oligopeptide/nickel transport system permease subunit